MFVPGSTAARFIGDMLPQLTSDDLGRAAGMRVFFLKRAPFTRPLLRIPNEETFVYLAMLRSPTTDRDVVLRMLEGNRTLFERNRAVGGMIYPFCALELSPDDWQRHYGEVGQGIETCKTPLRSRQCTERQRWPESNTLLGEWRHICKNCDA